MTQAALKEVLAESDEGQLGLEELEFVLITQNQVFNRLKLNSILP